MARNAFAATLTSPAAIAAVCADPSLLASGVPPLCIDEYQKAPVILNAIKTRLNAGSAAGMYLSGSTRFEALPTAAQSLTGRLHRVPVMPFTQAEIDHTGSRFLERAFEGTLAHTSQPSATDRADYIDRVTAGGFPLALSRPSAAARSRWFADHVRLTIERDARDIRRLTHAAALPRVLNRLAGHTAHVLNASRVASDLEISANTVTSYIKLLESLFLVSMWSACCRRGV